MFGEIYQGKRVFVTGHTGFKGGWLTLWLQQLGAEVYAYSLPPTAFKEIYGLLGGVDDFLGDIRNGEDLEHCLKNFQPAFVFHLAAQPLVLESYRSPLETLETNVTGTAILLDAVRKLELDTTVVTVTSDKCYENRETGQPYAEGDSLGGRDVYSVSKAAAELVAAGWRSSFFTGGGRVRLATARAGNVIGGGDFGEHRIVPDCVRMLAQGETITVRNPESIRPWQHVLDSLSGYLALGAFLDGGGDPGEPAAFNFGPDPSDNRTVGDLVTEVLKSWPGSWSHMPVENQNHEAGLLNLSIEKAKTVLDWMPTWNFETAVEKSILWYRTHAENQPSESALREFSLQQIDEFVRTAQAKGVGWATTP